MHINSEDMKSRIEVATKREKADVVIKNGKVIDVFNHTIMEVDIAIVNGAIVGLGEYEGKRVIDAQSKYICPSFIDSHVHIESSMVSPSEFSKVVVPHGVTTIIADPHEIANVSGVDGINYMLEASEHLPLNVFMMLPSCVPATPFENAGAILHADDLSPLYDHPRVLGLGEVMDYPSVANGSNVMIEKLVHAGQKGKKIDGHAAGLGGDAINVYKTVGINTDHESVSVTEAKERLERGMYLIIRQGSVAQDLPNLISIVTEYNSRRCLFGTDDKHIDDLIHEGSIDHNVRLAINHGLDPITAIQIASLNAAECYGLSSKGAIAPGYDADFLFLNDLKKVDVDQVYVAGQLVAEKGNYLCADISNQERRPQLKQSIHLSKISKENLQLRFGNDTKANIIKIIPNSLLTTHLIEEVNLKNSLFQPCIQNDQLKIAIIERHHMTGNIGLGVVKGLQLKKGAIATTIAHDSHNLIVAGTNDDDILFAIHKIKEMEGGLVVVEDQRTTASLPLAISGIISEHSYQVVHEQLENINYAVRELGASKEFNPFLTLSFLALPVIPELKLTDLGLFDVTRFKHIDSKVEISELHSN